MAFWKQKHNQTDGFSLIEAVVAIAILGIIAVPMLTSLLDSYRLNLRSDERLQAQLAVSSAVETIMAEGFDPANEKDYEEKFGIVIPNGTKSFEDATTPAEIEGVTQVGAAYHVILFATDKDGNYIEDIYVTTHFRPKGGDDDE